jgi:hypothetical protein
MEGNNAALSRIPSLVGCGHRLAGRVVRPRDRRQPLQTRRRLIDAEAQRLEALGATLVRVICEDGVDHYGVAIRDPEGNEFDIN